MVRSSPGRLSSNANAMPVNSGRVEDGAPTTATLRAGTRPPIETKAAPMRPSSLREPSVATTIPGYRYALPTGPYAASPLHGSAGSTPSAVRRRWDRRSLSSPDACGPDTAAELAQRVQPSAVFVAPMVPFLQLPLAAAARVPLRNTYTSAAPAHRRAFTCGSRVDFLVSAYQAPPAGRPLCVRHICRCSGIDNVSRLSTVLVGGAPVSPPHPSSVPQFLYARANADGATSGLHPRIQSAASTPWTWVQNWAEGTPLVSSSFSTSAIHLGSVRHTSTASYAVVNHPHRPCFTVPTCCPSLSMRTSPFLVVAVYGP